VQEGAAVSAATTVDFPAGLHIFEAATLLVEVALRDGASVGVFNGVRLEATPERSAATIVADYDRISNERAEAYRRSPEGVAAAERSNCERQRLQGIHDALIARMPTIWRSEVAILNWLCEMQEPSDRIGVIIKKETIAAAFARHNYLPGMDCGPNFKRGDRFSEWRYLVGQALDGIVNGPAIHGIIHKFADEWRAKWGSPQ
jgi:hypothetical protein